MLAKLSARSYFLRLVIFSSLFGVVLWKFGLYSFADYFSLETLFAAPVVQPIVFLGFVVAALWLAILVQTPAAPFGKSFKAQVLSRGCNVLLPGHAAELLKATYLLDHAGVSLSAGLSGVLLERMMDTLMVGLLAMLAISLTLVDVNITIFAVAALSVIIVLVVITRTQNQLIKLVSYVPWGLPRKFLEKLLTQASAPLSAGITRTALLYSVAVWLIALVNVTLFLILVGSIPIGLTGALMVFVASTIGGAIPALPAVLGTYEAAVVFVLKDLGYGFEEAIAIGLALHASQIILSLAGASAIIMTERLGLTSLWAEIIGLLKSGKDS